MGVAATLAIASVASANTLGTIKRVSTFLTHELTHEQDFNSPEPDPNSSTPEDVSHYTDDYGRTIVVYTDTGNYMPNEQKVGFLDVADPSNPIPDGFMSLYDYDYDSFFVNPDPNAELQDTFLTPRFIQVFQQWAIVGTECRFTTTGGTVYRHGLVLFIDIETRTIEGVIQVLPDDDRVMVPTQVILDGEDSFYISFEDLNSSYYKWYLYETATGSLIEDLQSFPSGDVWNNSLHSSFQSWLNVDGIKKSSAFIGPGVDSKYYATSKDDHGFLIYENQEYPAASSNIVTAYDSGDFLDVKATQIGHYTYDLPVVVNTTLYVNIEGAEYLFVGSQTSTAVFVYDVSYMFEPLLVQTLTTSSIPMGLDFVPGKNLLVVASLPGYGVLSSVTIFELTDIFAINEYPEIVSPYSIPFWDLSGLAADVGVYAPDGSEDVCEKNPNILYSVASGSPDGRARILTIVSEDFEASVITKENYITDNLGIAGQDDCLGSTQIDPVDLTLTIDATGITVADRDIGLSCDDDRLGFWVVTRENQGKSGVMLKVNSSFVVTQCVSLDQALGPGFGFRGVAQDGKNTVVTIASETGLAYQIGVYNPEWDTEGWGSPWKHAYFSLTTSADTGKIESSLSDIAFAGPGKFYVIEDYYINFKNSFTDVKKISTIDLGDYSFDTSIFNLGAEELYPNTLPYLQKDAVKCLYCYLKKEFYRDLIPDLLTTNGQIPRALNLAISPTGKVWINDRNVGDSEHFFRNVSTIANAPRCENRQDPFTIGTGGKKRETTCLEVASERTRKRDRQCDKPEVAANCPGLCNYRHQCRCSNFPIPFQNKGKNSNWTTCDELAALPKQRREDKCDRCKMHDYCPGVCSSRCQEEATSMS